MSEVVVISLSRDELRQMVQPVGINPDRFSSVLISSGEFCNIHKLSESTLFRYISKRWSQFNNAGKPKHTRRINCQFLSPQNWLNFPTQSPVRGRNDGLSSGLAGITVSKHRNESIKAYGNSVVPQLVYQIFKAINEFNQLNQ